jgi:hypothetical protein
MVSGRCSDDGENGLELARQDPAEASCLLGAATIWSIFGGMKNLIRSTVLSLCFATACMAYGAVPSLNVTVSDASGKAAFKGTTDRSGGFTTSKVKPGNYVVQFNSPNAVQGSYSIVVSAGVKKVSASGVAGEKFAKGGVALKVDVANLLNIVGQVATEAAGASKNGKKMVWLPPQLGSNRPGRWVEEDSAEAKQAKTAGSLSTRDIQNRQDRGISPGN